MDKAEIRRAYLRCGGDIRATAKVLGITRPTVYRALAALPPLTRDTPPDTPDGAAIEAYIDACLTRAGIPGLW